MVDTDAASSPQNALSVHAKSVLESFSHTHPSMRVSDCLCALTEITEPQTWERSLRFICPCRADFSQSTSLSSRLYSFHAFSISCGAKQNTLHVFEDMKQISDIVLISQRQCCFNALRVPPHHRHDVPLNTFIQYVMKCCRKKKRCVEVLQFY